MPRISKVGDGHALPDYATRALWWAVESAVDYGGLPIVAELLGDCGEDYNLSGSSVNGAECYTDGVTYDGTNESELAVTSKCIISVSNSFIEHDLRYATDNTSFYAFTLTSDDYTGVNLRVDTVRHGIAINGNYTNSSINNFIIKGANDGNGNGVYGGYNRGTNLSNGLIFNCQNGVNSNRTEMVLNNVFAFNNSNNDFVSGSTRNNCASEDSTGDYTGYTSAELVDFANGDLRTKSTSDLATLGSPFIGAFLESGGGGGVTVDDSSSNSSSISNNDSIKYVGKFLVSDSLSNSDGSVNQDSISFASIVNISDTVNGSLTVASSDNVYLVGELFVNDSIVGSGSTASDDSITLAATIIVNDSLIDSISLAVNDSIQLSGAFNVIDQLINSASIANNDSISFSSTVVVSDQLSNSGSVSNNDSVSFIGSVVISDQLTNSLSLANVDLISFAGEIIITDSAVNSSSSSGNDFIQIGAFEFTVYKETNISSIPKSRNINSPSLSTNIDG